MEKTIWWFEDNGDWRKALLICDCKSLVDAVGNSHAPEEGPRLVQATVARLHAEVPRGTVGTWSLLPDYSLSLRRRSSWSDLAGLQCVDGIPHDRGPCAAVLGHIGADHWPLGRKSALRRTRS